MYVVVDSKEGHVFGPFGSEDKAIAWAKKEYIHRHSTWYVEIVSKPH